MSSDLPSAESRFQRRLATLEGLLALDAIDLQSTLDQAARLVADVLDCDKIDIFMYHPATQTLIALGISPTPMGQREIAIGLDRQPVANAGRAVEAFLTGRPYFGGHVDQDEGELLGIREGMGVRSEMIVPLDAAGERRGVLIANSATAESFSEADLRFLEAVARWVGMVTHRTELVEQVARDAERRGRRAALTDLIDRLTPREQEVAALIALGLTNAEIARRLTITEGTAANHVRSILEKMGVPSRARVAALVAQVDAFPN